LVADARGCPIRPANNSLNISFSGVNDFVITVMAASGANIRCGIDASFAGKLEEVKSLHSCTLTFELDQCCLDARLAIFLYEVLGMAVVKAPLEHCHLRKEWAEIKTWEEWLSARTVGGFSAPASS